MDSKDVFALLEQQDRKWLKIEGYEYEFLYEKTCGTKILKSWLKDENKDEERKVVEFDTTIEVFINSIIDWKNVKIKDLADNHYGLTEEQLETEVKFSPKLLNNKLFSNQPGLILALINESNKSKISELEEKEDKKKE